MATAEIDLEMERQCAKCYGTGKDPCALNQPCAPCNGVGYFPTDVGASIIKMLKRYWKLEDIQR